MKTYTKREDPRDLGLYMPGEWTAHACCWMAWPMRDGLWPDQGATELAYADVANTIARFEPVNMLVAPNKRESAKKVLGEIVEIIVHGAPLPYCSASGPTAGADSEKVSRALSASRTKKRS